MTTSKKGTSAATMAYNLDVAGTLPRGRPRQDGWIDRQLDGQTAITRVAEPAPIRDKCQFDDDDFSEVI